MTRQELPPEYQPDTIDIGPVKGIPIADEDDPRFAEERAAWSAANKAAQSKITEEELLDGLKDPDWKVRFKVVDRLVARWGSDPRTLPALLAAFESDESDAVRSRIAARLVDFEFEEAAAALAAAVDDRDEDVRWWARYSLGLLSDAELGLADPGPDAGNDEA